MVLQRIRLKTTTDSFPLMKKQQSGTIITRKRPAKQIPRLDPQGKPLKGTRLVQYLLTNECWLMNFWREKKESMCALVLVINVRLMQIWIVVKQMLNITTFGHIDSPIPIQNISFDVCFGSCLFKICCMFCYFFIFIKIRISIFVMTQSNIKVCLHSSVFRFNI